MLTAFVRAFQTPDLRKKMLVTLALIALFRLGASLPTPGISEKNVAACSNLATCAGAVHPAHGDPDCLPSSHLSNALRCTRAVADPDCCRTCVSSCARSFLPWGVDGEYCSEPKKMSEPMVYARA